MVFATSMMLPKLPRVAKSGCTGVYAICVAHHVMANESIRVRCSIYTPRWGVRRVKEMDQVKAPIRIFHPHFLLNPYSQRRWRVTSGP